jgi:hypothetical protein
MLNGPGEPVQRVGLNTGRLGELGRGRRRRGKTENMAAAGGPHVGQDLQRGGLARPGRSNHQLHPAPVDGHGAHHQGLPGIQRGAAGCCLAEP